MSKLLKCQFHSHAFGDPLDHINYSPKTLINKAAELGYEVLAITCHRKIIFDEELKNYAAEKGILLLRGVEFEIKKKHILGINVAEEIMKVKDYEQLRAYRKKHPETLIIAPHPYFPGHFSLGPALEKNIDCFDAIEISWFYTKHLNRNRQAILMAEKHQKPLVSTADCHILSYLDIGYCSVKTEKNAEAIVQAVKNGDLENFTKVTTVLRMSRQILQIGWQKISKLPKKIR